MRTLSCTCITINETNAIHKVPWNHFNSISLVLKIHMKGCFFYLLTSSLYAEYPAVWFKFRLWVVKLVESFNTWVICFDSQQSCFNMFHQLFFVWLNLCFVLTKIAYHKPVFHAKNGFFVWSRRRKYVSDKYVSESESRKWPKQAQNKTVDEFTSTCFLRWT